MRTTWIVAAGFSFALGMCPWTSATSAAQGISLAQEGRTSYQIVTPATPSAVDEYAARELGGYLKQATGAEFPVVSPATCAPDRPAIFIGLSDPVLKRIGQDPLGKLKEQEHVTRSIGQDIFLYGKGVHGNLHAVFAFLEEGVGWRWYSLYEHPVIPSRPTLALKPFNRTQGFSFAYRHVGVQRGMDYYYQNGMNLGFDSRVKSIARRTNPDAARSLGRFVSAIHEEDAVTHTLFSYIPPKPSAEGANRFPWLERRNYFETNPDFFSMAENGERTSGRHLCFANPGLRKELTKNVLKHLQQDGEDLLVDITAMDVPERFCGCIECKALEEKYKSPGGPLYDYLIELCDTLAVQYPKARVKTLAYRLSQTQKPPVLPAGKRLPGNLIIDFAPIEDCYFADWTHPDPSIQNTYKDLVAWGTITDNLWAWLYPNPWGTGMTMPVGNIERNINQMRLMAKAGVKGIFTDHCSYNERGGWSELQQYVLFRLMKDINGDTEAVVREVTDHLYGPAAPLMRRYLNELEQGRKAMTKLPLGVTYRSPNIDDRTFPYLTPENLFRWQGYFDEMDKLLAGQPARLTVNVQLVRRHLDLATLWKWSALRKQYPTYFTDHAVCVNRITAVNRTKGLPKTKWEEESGKAPSRDPAPLGEGAMQDFVTLIQCGGEEKPLPAEFRNMDPSNIRRFVPKYSNKRGGRAVVPDPEAAFGYGVPVHTPDLPFQFGFYQNDRKSHGARIALEAKQTQPGAYALHKLGVIDVTPDCIIWFSARSWATQLQVGERLYEPGADNHWTAYISARFDGPTYGAPPNDKLLASSERAPYGGPSGKDLVLVDQIILVRQEGK